VQLMLHPLLQVQYCTIHYALQSLYTAPTTAGTVLHHTLCTALTVHCVYYTPYPLYTVPTTHCTHYTPYPPHTALATAARSGTLLVSGPADSGGAQAMGGSAAALHPCCHHGPDGRTPSRYSHPALSYHR
jgi:hypothetical protein